MVEDGSSVELYKDVSPRALQPVSDKQSAQLEKLDRRKQLAQQLGIFLPATTFSPRKHISLNMQNLQPLLTS